MVNAADFLVVGLKSSLNISHSSNIDALDIRYSYVNSKSDLCRGFCLTVCPLLLFLTAKYAVIPVIIGYFASIKSLYENSELLFVSRVEKSIVSNKKVVGNRSRVARLAFSEPNFRNLAFFESESVLFSTQKHNADGTIGLRQKKGCDGTRVVFESSSHL